MKAPRLSTLAFAGTLALACCKDKEKTPDVLEDGIEETRLSAEVVLSDRPPSECKVEKTNFEWNLIQGKCDENGMAQGPGKAISNNGNVYEGGFKDGKFDGHGIFTWSDGDKYVGEYKDGEYHGHGVWTSPDGRVYDGEWKDGEHHGHGVFTWPDGDKYVGEYKDDKRHGHGVYTWPDGRVYDGEFNDGESHGHGVFTWPDGRIYDGEWKDDEKNGHGVLTWSDGISVGEWKDDEPVKGKIKEYKTPNAIYVYAAGLETEGKVDEAKAAYQHLMRIKPDSEAAVKAAERLLVLSGKNEDAPKTGE